MPDLISEGKRIRKILKEAGRHSPAAVTIYFAYTTEDGVEKSVDCSVSELWDNWFDCYNLQPELEVYNVEFEYKDRARVSGRKCVSVNSKKMQYVFQCGELMGYIYRCWLQLKPKNPDFVKM